MFQGVTPNQIPARILNKGFYCTSSLPVLYPERGRGRRQTENQSARTSRPEEKTKSLKVKRPFPAFSSRKLEVKWRKRRRRLFCLPLQSRWRIHFGFKSDYHRCDLALPVFKVSPVRRARFNVSLKNWSGIRASNRPPPSRFFHLSSAMLLLLFSDKPNLIVKTEDDVIKKKKKWSQEKQTKCINFLSDMCRSDKLKSSCFGFIFWVSSFYGVHGTWSVEYYPVQCL